MTTIPLAVIAVLVVILAFFLVVRLLFRPDTRTGSVDRLRECLITLSLMKEGSNLGVLDKRSRRFIQFLRDGGQKELAIIFDFPESRGNVRYFEDMKDMLLDGGWSYEISGIPGTEDDQPNLRVFQIRIQGESAEVIDIAEKLGRAALEVLELGRGTELRFALLGEADESAQRKELSDSLGQLAESRIPWLSALARKQLDKVDVEEK